MKYIKIILLVTGLFLSSGLWADPSINYKLRNISDNKPVEKFTFSGISDATIDNPWVIADQYIHLTYKSDETMWMMRIFTNNEDMFPDMYGKPIAEGDNEKYDGPPEAEPLSDDIISYGGLINEVTQKNPENRVGLAWQVFRYNDPYNPPPEGMEVTPPTLLTDTTIGGLPSDPWGYLCDMNDTGFVKDPINNYFWVAYGTGAFSLLAQHPVVYKDDKGNPLPKPGGGEAIIYIGTCFGKNQNTEKPGGLSAGDYESVIYLQLFHE